MIGSLTGKVTKKLPKHLLVDVHDVGYLVAVPAEMREKISLGDPCTLFIHSHVRDDEFALYGFDNFEALQFFELLLTVNRVGPKVALDIMNASPPRVKTAIVKKDLAYLASIQGVGKKTAERVILELRDKITLESLDETLKNTTLQDEHEDVTQALMKLGYDRKHISRVLREIPDEIQKEEDIIKYFLKYA